MKRQVSGVLAGLALTMALSLPVCAAQYQAEADSLNRLGLFLGTENGYELERTFTREEGAVMLVRLLGAEEQVKNTDYVSIFRDVEDGRWSENYVMYCYENNITKGTGADTFDPEAAMPADEFVTLVLRTLGYASAEPQTAYQSAVEYGLLDSEYVQKLQSAGEFLRDDMVYIAYRSLQTPTKEGEILARVLQRDGVLTEEQAAQFDIYENAQNMDDILDSLLDE